MCGIYVQNLLIFASIFLAQILTYKMYFVFKHKSECIQKLRFMLNIQFLGSS